MSARLTGATLPLAYVHVSRKTWFLFFRIQSRNAHSPAWRSLTPSILQRTSKSLATTSSTRKEFAFVISGGLLPCYLAAIIENGEREGDPRAVEAGGCFNAMARQESQQYWPRYDAPTRRM